MDVQLVKLVPPRRSPGLVGRSRLQDRLKAVIERPLSLVVAPAGYGKTTLLLQWYHRLQETGQPAGWVSLDSGDRDAASLAALIVAAISSATPEPSTTVPQFGGLHQHPAAGDAMVGMIVQWIGRLKRPVVLFVDDWHNADQGATRLFAKLVEYASESLRFVLASRTLPELAIPRLRARGWLVEVGAEDLRFTEAETRAFMALAGCDDLQDSELELLANRTEGWGTGLRLASLCLQGEADRRRMISAFNGKRRPISEFFTDDVLASQPPEIREFLLKTAILRRLSVPLCQALTERDDCRELLARIERSGLFLIQLDEEGRWFRYHSLFSEYLGRILEEEHADWVPRLHAIASEWLAGQGFVIEALEHAANARDEARIAILLDRHAEQLTYNGHLRLIGDYATGMDPAVLIERPHLLLAFGWLRTRNMRFPEARWLLDRATDYLADPTRRARHTESELAHLKLTLLHREAMLAAGQDRMVQVEEQCQKLIGSFGPAHSYITCTLYAQVLLAQREQYKFAALERVQAQARAAIDRSQYKFASVNVLGIIGLTLLAGGKTEGALEAFEQGLQEALRFHGPNSALAALAALPMAELLYERNEIDRSQDLLEHHLPVAREFGFADQLISGYVTHPQILYARGDETACFKAVEEGLNVALELGLERLRAALIAMKIRLLLRAGRLKEAQEAGRASGLPLHGGELLPKGAVQRSDELRALAWVRLTHSQGRSKEALEVAARWQAFCQHRGAIRSLVRWQLIVAQLHVAQGEPRPAQRVLREALTAGERGGFIRNFIDEGAVVHGLIFEGYGKAPSTGSAVDRFAREILEACQAVASAPAPGAAENLEGIYGHLTNKEIEILSFISSGLRNREIGERLGMTEGSVKWYMQQVYDKLGTRRRSQAVERVRQLGLL